MFHLSVQSWFFLALWVVALTSAVLWGQSFRKRQRNLMGNMAIYFGLSATILFVAVGSLATKGLNYGLDFTGGTLLEVGVYRQVSVEEVHEALKGFKQPVLGEPLVQVGADMVADGDKQYQRVVVRVTRAESLPDGGKELRDQEPTALKNHLAAKFGEMKELSTASIGPTVTGELRYHAFVAMGVAMLVQGLYIFLRFGFQWRYGIAADIAILHDIVIMLGLYSLAGRQLDSPFVAALMTVAGYSVMDSVVIFDRIRENDQYYGGKKPFPEIVNTSVNQTMTRSVNTTLTVLITLVAIYFFGGSSLQNFAFALLVGITSGAYSSVFVAAPSLVIIDKYFKSAPKPVVSYTAVASDEVDPVYEETGTDAPKRRRVRGMRRRL
ncbi:protein translocase subunit SecF [bacterium]|nr:protein translocase subunit SecF [bacterium]